jgi:hypothetical protein
MIVGEMFTCPELRVEPGGLPSAAASIRHFLTQDSSADAAANADSGWSQIWAALESNIAA